MISKNTRIAIIFLFANFLSVFGENCKQGVIDDVSVPARHLKAVKTNSRIDCDFLNLDYGRIGRVKISVCNSTKPFEPKSGEDYVIVRCEAYGDYDRYKSINKNSQKPTLIVFASRVPPYRSVTIVIESRGNELIYPIADLIRPSSQIAPKNPEIVDGD